MGIDRLGAWAPDDADDASGGFAGGDASAFPEDGSPFDANLFDDELVHIDASDWDVDADAIWGEDPALDAGSPGFGFDIPLG